VLSYFMGQHPMLGTSEQVRLAGANCTALDQSVSRLRRTSFSAERTGPELRFRFVRQAASLLCPGGYKQLNNLLFLVNVRPEEGRLTGWILEIDVGAFSDQSFHYRHVSR